MSELRKVKKIVQGRKMLEGAGVHLKRVIGSGDPYEYDPFLLLDDFRSDNPEEYIKGFPWHPHRGIETITYVLEGIVEHEDSTGNKGVIGAGDIQWMTAGSGVYHKEMPKGNIHGKMYGFQLWANLPEKSKMMDPRYQGILADEIPEVKCDNGVEVCVIAGEYDGVKGPVKDIVIAPEYYDVSVPAGVKHKIEVEKGKTLFAYVFYGSGNFSGNGAESSEKAKNGDLLLFEDGDYMEVETNSSHVRFLLISGKPIKESIAWHGPIVMNTEEELEKAFDELREGTFIKVKS